MITVEEMDHIINQVCGYLEDDPNIGGYVVEGIENIIRRFVSEQKEVMYDKVMQKLTQRILVLEQKVQDLQEH